MKLVVFDCDGTLVDSQHMIVAAMEQAFASEGLAHPARDKILSIVGLSLPNAVTHLVPVRDEEMIARIAERYKEAFGELRKSPEHREPLFPGAREALDALMQRPGMRLGIATGKSRRGVAALLEREGLQDYFSTIQTSDTHPSKPHPAMLHEALTEAGVDGDDAVMVGDTTFDIEMALAAGIGAVGVGWGYHDPYQLHLFGAHHIINRFDELTGVIDRMIAAREAAA